MPATTDVVVVGAGITGALVADSLAAAGFGVTVLDRRPPGEGSTAACTGILTYELDVEFAALAKQAGDDVAARSYRACVEGVRMVAALVQTLHDRCGFTWRRSIYFGRKRRDTERLQREAELRRRAGIDVDYLSSAQVEAEFGLDSHGALSTTVAAVVDPVRLTRALLERAQKAGAVVSAPTTVLRWSSNKRGVTVETDRGTIRANWIVIATGYETPPELSGDLVSLRSSYALATHPVDKLGAWAAGCILWDTSRPYIYVRPAEGNRIVIGGADIPFRNATVRDQLLPGRIRRLEGELEHLFPALETETEFTWAGTFAETSDGLPYIGPHKSIPRALFALGYGGNGIVFSALASQILRDIILGEGHEYLDLFSFDR